MSQSQPLLEVATWSWNALPLPRLARPGSAEGLPEGHTLVPLIYSTKSGWLNLEGLAFWQRILSQVTAAEPPLGVDDWKPHVSHITQQHLARLAHAMHLSHWQMSHACGRLL